MTDHRARIEQTLADLGVRITEKPGRGMSLGVWFGKQSGVLYDASACLLGSRLSIWLSPQIDLPLWLPAAVSERLTWFAMWSTSPVSVRSGRNGSVVFRLLDRADEETLVERVRQGFERCAHIAEVATGQVLKPFAERASLGQVQTLPSSLGPFRNEVDPVAAVVQVLPVSVN